MSTPSSSSSPSSRSGSPHIRRTINWTAAALSHHHNNHNFQEDMGFFDDFASSSFEGGESSMILAGAIAMNKKERHHHRVEFPMMMPLRITADAPLGMIKGFDHHDNDCGDNAAPREEGKDTGFGNHF